MSLSLVTVNLRISPFTDLLIDTTPITKPLVTTGSGACTASDFTGTGRFFWLASVFDGRDGGKVGFGDPRSAADLVQVALRVPDRARLV